MAAVEAALLLLQDKLQILNSDEVIFYPGLRKKLKEAISKLNDISLLLKDEEVKHESNQEEILHKIQFVEDVTDMFYLKRARQRRMRSSLVFTPLMSLSPLWRQKYLSNGIAKFICEMKMVKDKHKLMPTSQDRKQITKHSDDGEEASNRWRKISRYAEMEATVIVRDEKIGELKARLINNKDETANNEIQVIPVVGEAGSGKTSLVRYVYNNVDIKNHFEVRAWVYVSNDYVYRDVVVDLLRQSASSYVKDVDHMDDNKLAGVLVKNLMEKRYLIVLDDVGDVEVWEKLTVAFPDSRNGSSVILTTVPDLAHRIDPWSSPYQLKKLSDEESRRLLQYQLKWIETFDQEKKEEIKTCYASLEDRIIKLCHGLPMNIVLLGGLLSTTESTEWSSVIEDLESNGKHQSSTFNLVKLSYNRLHPDQLKPCFLYLSLFPKTFGVPLRRLLGLWLAEGLVTISPHGENLLPEDQAVRNIEALVTRKIVEVSRWGPDGSPRACRLPGLVYDFFCSKTANKDYFFCSKTANTNPFLVHRCTNKDCAGNQESSIRRQRVAELSDTNNSLESLTDHHLLRSFFSFNTSIRGTPKTYVGSWLKTLVEKRGFGLLKVLDLEGVYKPQLPESLGKLYLLRYLGLRSTVLDSLPEFLGNLPSLETLDVKYTNIATLPYSIWKAKNLRHLHMNEVRLDIFHHKPSRAFLNNLLTLTGLYIGDEKVVTDILGKLTSIRKLGLTCHSSAAKVVVKWISKMTNLQSLKLRVVDKYGKPSEVELTTPMQQNTLSKLSKLYLMGSVVNPVKFCELLPSSLRILTLSMSRLEQDPMQFLGKLKFLKILKLLASSYTGKRMTCLQGDFPELRVLKLWKLEVKEFLVEEKAMTKLQELEIRGCDNLETCMGLEEVSSLKELVLTNMKQNFIEAVKSQMKSHVFVKVNNWNDSHA